MSEVSRPAPTPPADGDVHPARPRPLAIIEGSGRWSLGLADLWSYRELVWFLAVRDIMVRYKQTVFGVGWAVLQPLLTMAVFTFVLGRLAGLSGTTGAVPYPVYTFAALLPWQLFTRGLTESATSLITNRNLVTKVYFPRIVIPFAPVLAGLVDFAVAFVALLGLMLAFDVPLRLSILAAPLFVAMACLAAMAVGVWLSALVAVFRDLRHVLPLLVQIWMFLSPVAYPVDLVPAGWRGLYALNPMVGVIEGLRWALFGQAPPAPSVLIPSAAALIALALVGLVMFQRLEPRFADEV